MLILGVVGIDQPLLQLTVLTDLHRGKQLQGLFYPAGQFGIFHL